MSLAIVMAFVLLLAFAAGAAAQTASVNPSDRSTEASGAVLFLFGAFCALWAQNTGRSAWLWFFLGALFSIVTVIVLLYKNSSDRRAAHAT